MIQLASIGWSYETTSASSCGRRSALFHLRLKIMLPPSRKLKSYWGTSQVLCRIFLVCVPPPPLTLLFFVKEAIKQGAIKQAVCFWWTGNEGCTYACSLAQILSSEKPLLPFPQVLQKVSVLARNSLQRIAMALGDLDASAWWIHTQQTCILVLPW